MKNYFPIGIMIYKIQTAYLFIFNSCVFSPYFILRLRHLNYVQLFLMNSLHFERSFPSCCISFGNLIDVHVTNRQRAFSKHTIQELFLHNYILKREFEIIETCSLWNLFNIALRTIFISSKSRMWIIELNKLYFFVITYKKLNSEIIDIN